MTSFDELRETCGVTLIGTLQTISDLKRHVECFSEGRLTSKPILVFKIDFGSPGKPTMNAFRMAKGDNIEKGSVFYRTDDKEP